MKIKFWGTRGSIASPGKDTIIYGGNTTCVEIQPASGELVIIDAGTGIRGLGDQLKAQQEIKQVHLLITHIHWDHLFGFPFFAPIYDESFRILIDGAPNCMKGLRYPFDNKMGDGFFPVSFNDLTARITFLDTLSKGVLEIGSIIIDKINLCHPQGGFGFRFNENGKILVFITDNELCTEGLNGPKFDEFEKFCQGADVLIHDAQYVAEEFEVRQGWGHSNYEMVLDLGLKAGVSQLVLFHHDPSRKDSELEIIEKRCQSEVKRRGGKLTVYAAREGSEIII